MQYSSRASIDSSFKLAWSKAQDAVLLHRQILLAASDGSLGLCQSGTRNSEWRAADVVESNRIKEEDAGWISTVLAADRKRQIRVCLASIEGGKLYKPTNAALVNGLEWIFWKELSFDVLGNEDTGVVCGIGKERYHNHEII